MNRPSATRNKPTARRVRAAAQPEPDFDEAEYERQMAASLEKAPPSDEEVSREEFAERAAREPIEAGIPKPTSEGADVAVGAFYEILDDYDIGKLRDMARERSIPHYDTMHKADLIEYIVRHDYEPKLQEPGGEAQEDWSDESRPNPPDPKLLDGEMAFTLEEFAVILGAMTARNNQSQGHGLLASWHNGQMYVQRSENGTFYQSVLELPESIVVKAARVE